jgi:hypothetical protein
VEQIAEYANMINVKTAEALGVTIPDALKKDFVLIGQ